MASPTKPNGAKLRNAKTLVRGQCYPIDLVYQEKSKFPDAATGLFPVKTIAVYKDLETFVFYTYLCNDYNDKSAEYVADINAKCAAGNNIRLVYYGSIGNYNVTKLLMEGEVVNQTTLSGIAAIQNGGSSSSTGSTGPGPTGPTGPTSPN